MAFERTRARLEGSSPSKAVENAGITRYVRVRWMIPGVGHQVDIYDRENKDDMKVWRDNQALYPCQILGYSADRIHDFIPAELRCWEKP